MVSAHMEAIACGGSSNRRRGEMFRYMYPINEQFPQRLRKLRERRRISRHVLSELCGLTGDAIRRYENGETSPTMKSLVAIADFFEVSVDYLVGRSDSP